jgi:uncharacterized membrane protein YfcA
MKKHHIGLVLMLAGIGVMGFQIGATAKYQDSRYIFLMPIGIGLLLVGMFLWFRNVAKAKQEEGDT